MMRTFAWCGTYTSTSSTVSSQCCEHGLRRADEHAGRELEDLAPVHLSGTARWPSRRCASRCPGSGARAPPEPSAPSSKPRKPPSSTCSSTTAPAPSPKSTSVERSVQSSDPREDVAADDERPLGEPGRDRRVRLGERVHEAGAARREVVGRRIAAPELRRRRAPPSPGTPCPGVIVATMIRSRSRARRRPPARAPARAAGSARSDIASCSAAIRRSRIPVRVADPLVGGVDDLRELVVRHAPARARSKPRPVIETGRPGRAADHSRAHREGQRSANRELAVDRRPAPCPCPIGPAHRLDLAEQLERLAGPDDPLEADVVDAGEEDEPAARSRAARAPRPRRTGRAPRPSSRPA